MVESIKAVVGWHHTLRPIAQRLRVCFGNGRNGQIIFKVFRI
jgi:hypothetical protein